MPTQRNWLTTRETGRVCRPLGVQLSASGFDSWAKGIAKWKFLALPRLGIGSSLHHRRYQSLSEGTEEDRIYGEQVVIWIWDETDRQDKG